MPMWAASARHVSVAVAASFGGGSLSSQNCWTNVSVSEARLILTCGLPGAGKTTLARQLATERSAVRLTKDEWLWALGSSPWDRPTGEKIEQELWRLARDPEPRPERRPRFWALGADRT